VPPVTFTLAPDHRIVIAESSITVTYQGTERRVVTSGLPGAVPLPVQHTPLEVSQPMRARRHLIQSFIWVPDDPVKPSTWSLDWMLGEVVGAEFHMITGERSLVVVSAPEPPAPYDVASHTHPHKRRLRQCLRRDSAADVASYIDGCRWFLARLTRGLAGDLITQASAPTRDE
jgi:hypothetical protein